MRNRDIKAALGADEARRLWNLRLSGRIHRAPENDEAVTPCCGIAPCDLPLDDRIVSDPSRVTCR